MPQTLTTITFTLNFSKQTYYVDNVKEIREREVRRLTDLVEEEKRSYGQLSQTLRGYIRAEVDCCNMAISTQWLNGDEMFTIPSEKAHGTRPIVLSGEVATRVVMKAIDLLEDQIKFHKGQLHEAKRLRKEAIQ